MNEYITLQELLEGTYASIDFKDHFNPKNPIIDISGIGKMSKKELESAIIKQIEELYEYAKKKDFSKIYDIFNTKSILYYYIQAMKDIEFEQKSAKGKRYSTKYNKQQEQKRLEKEEEGEQDVSDD